MRSSSETSFSSSACISTPKSNKVGDRGAEVQEVELNRASGNGDLGCCGERDWSSCMGEVEPSNNRKKIVSPNLKALKKKKQKTKNKNPTNFSREMCHVVHQVLKKILC